MEGLAGTIDHTNLDPSAGSEDIVRLCEEARRYGFFSVCVNGVHVARAARLLAESPVVVCSVVGFPLGAAASPAKAAEARLALEAGAREIDMVCQIGALRAGDDEAVRADIQAVADVCRSEGATLKVILETGLLEADPKRRGCTLAAAAGADFVKTSTGFLAGGATVEDVALMRAEVGDALGVKASGGIRTLETARAMIAAGASRLGCSSSVAIVEQQTAAHPD